MPEVSKASIDEPKALEELFERFERDNPKFRIGFNLIEAKGGGYLTTGFDGVRYIWILDGDAEIYLPCGYRTNEGDGDRLPGFYTPDKLSPRVKRIFSVLTERLSDLSEETPYGDTIRNCVRSILERLRGEVFQGDISGEVAQLTPIERGGWCHTVWSNDPEVNQAVEELIEVFDGIGWSTKTRGSYEPVGMGDQVILKAGERLPVRGKIRYLWIEDLERVKPHAPTTRRVRFLKDLTGGCNIAFDPFRRLPLTWFVKGVSKMNPDGYNRVNSHIVNMAEEFSRTHFHPVKAIGGGKPQYEMYLVLDHAKYGLRTYGRRSYAYFFPDLENLAIYERMDLKPGDLVYIPPGTGHRAVNVLANVITLPGFKPRNEWYIDKKIRRVAGDRAPYNRYMISVSSRYDIA